MLYGGGTLALSECLFSNNQARGLGDDICISGMPEGDSRYINCKMSNNAGVKWQFHNDAKSNQDNLITIAEACTADGVTRIYPGNHGVCYSMSTTTNTTTTTTTTNTNTNTTTTGTVVSVKQVPTSHHSANQNAGGAGTGAESGGIVNSNAGNTNSTVNSSLGVGVDTTNSNSSIDSNPEASGKKKKSAAAPVLIVLFLLLGGGGFGWYVYRRRGNGPAASKRRAEAAMMELDPVGAQNVGMEYTNPIARPSVHGRSSTAGRSDTAVEDAATVAATNYSDAAVVGVGVYYSTVSEVPPIATEPAAYASTGNNAALYGGNRSTIASAYSAPLDGSLPSEAMYGGRGDNSDDGYEMPVGFPPKANNAPIYAIPFDSGEEVAYMATGSVRASPDCDC